jgi:DNA polymerase-3 subunit epsilon
MPLVGFDTETTGLSVQEDRIFEIGLVTFQGGERVDRFCELMDPCKPLSDVSREKTGVSDEDLRGKPTFASYADDIVRRLSGAVVVGYNILGYDLPLLQAELRRVGLDLPPMYPVDVLIFARQLAKGPRHTLGEMARQYGVEMETAHRATADADAAVRLLLALAQVSSLPQDLDELQRLQAQWREEQRAKRASWRQKPGAESRPEAILGGGTAGSAASSLVDAEGRISLGPGFVYGKDADPLRSYLASYFNLASSN